MLLDVNTNVLASTKLNKEEHRFLAKDLISSNFLKCKCWRARLIKICISSSNISRGTAFQIILDQVITDGSFREQVGYNLNRKSLYGIDVAGES